MGEPTHSRPANGSGERVRQINEALFSGSPAASALLARDSAQLAGIATYAGQLRRQARR